MQPIFSQPLRDLTVARCSLVLKAGMDSAGGSLIRGTFDDASLWCWLLILFLLASLLPTSLKLRPIGVFGMFLDQSVTARPKSSGLLVGIFSGTLFSIMYKSVLISQLTKPKPAMQLNSMDQLARMEPTFKVLVWTPSFLKTSLEEKLPALVTKGHFWFEENIYQEKVADMFLEGSLAIMTNEGDVLETILNPDLNPSVNCRVHKSNLHGSSEIFAKTFRSLLVSKTYKHTEKVRVELLKLLEFGLTSKHVSVKDRPKEYLFHTDKAGRKACNAKPKLHRTVPDCFRYEPGPQKLSVDQFRQLFWIWLMGLLMAALCLLCEVLEKKALRVRKQILT